MIRVFRVHQNSSLIGSYYNRWIADGSQKTTEYVPSASEVPFFNKLEKLQSTDLVNPTTIYCYKFLVEDEEFLLYSESEVESTDAEHKGEVECIMMDVAEYVKLNYMNEIVSGNMTRLLTQFLAGYFKKYESLLIKQKKITRIKQSLNSMQSVASQTFMSIVERGKAINEIKTDLDGISDHSLAFNYKSKKLKKKMWAQRFQAYKNAFIALLVLFVLLYFLL